MPKEDLALAPVDAGAVAAWSLDVLEVGLFFSLPVQCALFRGCGRADGGTPVFFQNSWAMSMFFNGRDRLETRDMQMFVQVEVGDAGLVSIE